MESEGVGMGEKIKGRVPECPLCGRTLFFANMVRHHASYSQLWDPGGGPSLLTEA